MYIGAIFFLPALTLCEAQFWSDTWQEEVDKMTPRFSWAFQQCHQSVLPGTLHNHFLRHISILYKRSGSKGQFQGLLLTLPDTEGTLVAATRYECCHHQHSCLYPTCSAHSSLPWWLTGVAMPSVRKGFTSQHRSGLLLPLQADQGELVPSLPLCFSP